MLSLDLKSGLGGILWKSPAGGGPAASRQRGSSAFALGGCFAGPSDEEKEKTLEYRTIPHTGDRASVIGLGIGSIHAASTDEIARTIDTALDAGVNMFDFIPSKACAFEGYKRAFKGAKRERAMFQVHLGADYTSGSYGWTTDCKRSLSQFHERLRTLGTDYADFGFMHCLDEDSDFDEVMRNGLWDAALRLKQEGVIRHLAFSTHSVNIAKRFLETGEMDLCMFSINPMYDYTDESQYGKGKTDERAELYRLFEAKGCAVTVMKAFAGGQLLDAKASPFGIALTQAQCLQYALDRPGVVSVLPGVRGLADLEKLLAFLDASPEERDYSVLAKCTPRAGESSCVYCNHCQPCPEGIAIGLVNKYYDLALLGDELAADHYRTLDVKAGSCVGCGHCDSRCPFGVAQSERMAEIARYFGE